MGRIKTVEKKIGKTTKEEMRRGFKLIRAGRSFHKVAEPARIPLSQAPLILNKGAGFHRSHKIGSSA